MTRLRIEGGREVNLARADFVGQGAEGAVYARGDVAYKVYTDPARMVPPAKVRELAALTDPRIIRPLALLLDAAGQPVGYTMRRVERGQPLGRLFTRSFRERMGLAPDRVLELVLRLRAGVAHVHAHGILIVDLNEMNFLLDAALRDVLFIDVAGYQTPHFPATALMESVRDRHASRFSEGTDWFSFGIISFQMFTGVHPYRGRHPSLSDLDSRMQANVSVLNPDVQVPPSAYPFSLIPKEYLDWYRSVVEEGRREAPPDLGVGRWTLGVGSQHPTPDARHPTSNAQRPTPNAQRLRCRELARFPADVICPVPAREGLGALTAEGLHLRGRPHAVPPEARFALAPRGGHLVAGWVESGRLCLYDASEGRRLDAAIAAEALTACDGRLCVKQGETLYEVELLELPSGIRAALREAGHVLEHATELFEGVAVQSVLGACYASVFPRAGACHVVRLPELDGRRVLDATYDRGVLVATAEQSGRYARFVFRFDPDHRAHDARETAVPSPAHPDFVTLETGVCLLLDESGELEVFFARRGSTEQQVIRDPALDGGRLFRDGSRVLLVRGSSVFEISSS